MADDMESFAIKASAIELRCVSRHNLLMDRQTMQAVWTDSADSNVMMAHCVSSSLRRSIALILQNMRRSGFIVLWCSLSTKAMTRS